MEQLCMDFPDMHWESKRGKGESCDLFPLEDYDTIIISHSSGKDSMGVLFRLLEEGADPKKMELVHQNVDGHPFEDEVPLKMDWPCAIPYVQAIGEIFGIPVSFQWREQGFYGELMRKDSRSKDVYYCDDDGNIVCLPTKQGKRSTRRKWPAMSHDLRIRYCSPYLKIDVFRRVLNNHPRYQGTEENPKKILFCSGERREESAARAKYNEVEYHASHRPNKRIIHHWRPVIDFKERDIWDAFERWSILPNFPYYLGWNRVSCFGCIFSTPDLWAMMREIAPERFRAIREMERELNFTIDPTMTVDEKADKGSLKRLPPDWKANPYVEKALTGNFTKEDLIVKGDFPIPAGAFIGAAGGPV